MPDGARYDVVVVGASIAGCTAAILYGRSGARVAVVERHADPGAYKTICTHFIQASATPTIRRLGLAERIEQAGGFRNEIELWTRWGWIRRPDRLDPGESAYGYNIRRELLDPMLRQLAQETPGVELLFGQRVAGLMRLNGSVSGVEIENRQGERRRLAARLVVGADGRSSSVAELAAMPQKTKPNNRFGYFAYYRNLPVASGEISQMWLLEPDIGYVFPNDNGVAIVLAAPKKDKLAAFKSDLEGSFTRFFEKLPRRPSLEQAERVSDFLGVVDYPSISRELTRPGLALIGDAGLVSDPVWGVGCGFAFQTAEWLVDATAEAVVGKADLGSALKRYQRRHHAMLAGHHFLMCDYSSGRPLNALERLIFSSAARDETMAHHLAKFGTRQSRVRDFLAPSALARAVWVNTGRRAGAGLA